MINGTHTAIVIDAGAQTENVIQFILDELEKDDDVTDLIEKVEREPSEDLGLARELVASSAIIVISLVGIKAITRIIEKYLNTQAAIRLNEIVISAPEDARPLLAKLAIEQSKLILGKELSELDVKRYLQNL
ncbi:TPA: hypothetical protein ACN36H_003139 [Vibrio parahaemolyticus]